MKKLIILLSLFLCVNSSFAYSNNEIPDEFYITEHWISLTTSFDIETKTKKLGTLYRKFFSLLLSYEFFDPHDNKLAVAKAKLFSLTAHFDVYDNQGALLGIAEERMLAFFPTFDIYAADKFTKLAKAKMNFWGTTFTIYDPATDQEMATMHRSFFRLKNDWTFKVSNKPLLMEKNIDPRVLMTVIAFQGDRERWAAMVEPKEDKEDNEDKNKNYRHYGTKKSLNATPQATEIAPQQLNLLLEKINTINQQEGLENSKIPDQKTLKIVAEELENNYKKTQADSFENQTTQEQVIRFTDYCLSLAQSKDISDEKKKAILHLLKMRLRNEVS